MKSFEKYHLIPHKLGACFLLASLCDTSERDPSPGLLCLLLCTKSLDTLPANSVFSPVRHLCCRCNAWLLRSQEQIKLSAYPTDHTETTRQSQERNSVFQSISQLNWENISSLACKTNVFIKPSAATEMRVFFTMQSWFLRRILSMLVIQEGRVLHYTELLIK